MEISNLYNKCIEGVAIRDDHFTYDVQRFSIGKIKILSGKIVACDFAMPSAYDPPFHQEVPNGEYPVSIIVARKLSNNDERIAAAIIDFSPFKPEKWTLATKGNEKLSELLPNHNYGYGVDSGVSAFLDLESAKVLANKFIANEVDFDEIKKHYDENYVHTRSWMLYEIDNVNKLNAAVFTSGYGDGVYSSYWGYSNDNSVVCLITDFEVLEDVGFIND